MQLIDTGSEPFFEDVVNHMAAICSTPIAMVVLECGRLWMNRPNYERGQESKGSSHELMRLLGRESAVVEDFPCVSQHWPSVEKPRSYIATPLILQGNFEGLLVLADTRPRVWNQFERDYMQRATRLVGGHFEA